MLYILENGYINGLMLCYKDGFELLVLNFFIICIDYKCYVIFYNERNVEIYFKGYVLLNVLMELCEVIV